MSLESSEIDATEKECSHFPKDHPARQGLPYVVNSFSTIKQGTNKSQSYVYPEMWRRSIEQWARLERKAFMVWLWNC
jgi:hypothetical protein